MMVMRGIFGYQFVKQILLVTESESRLRAEMSCSVHYESRLTVVEERSDRQALLFPSCQAGTDQW
jgi:hypothetical protein